MSVILQISLALQLCSFFPFLLLYHVLERPSAEPNRDSCRESATELHLVKFLNPPVAVKIPSSPGGRKPNF